jgi:uncharacterized membrane protein YkvA (DUF1232 family)
MAIGNLKVSRLIFKRLRAAAHRLKVSAHAVWIGARDPAVPLGARLFGLFVAAYAMSPIDLIPDFIPVLGLLDDLILVPLGVWLFVRMIPAELHACHMAEAEAADAKPVSRMAALIIITVWLAAILWMATLFFAGKYY